MDAIPVISSDRGLLLSLMHVFSSGHDPVLGPVARERFLDVYRIVRDEAGPAVPDARELTACGFGVEMKSLDQLRLLVGEASDFTSRR